MIFVGAGMLPATENPFPGAGQALIHP